eukprot:CAMPEP_0174252246 /NCGR_PEP_ID=MMETSP0439-20130205/1800_1 /TAXON_ID=0 /ORGANISM="Stereomyxa ramosa, Strain Chinc5" /LENGTH=280 /DNA_ID=CAMNT_0015332757 /DNA_START=54 /DNA_END=896 /DNA_ORIENTATION=+
MSAEVETKVVIIFYSLYTHTWQLAQALYEGAKEVEGVCVDMYQVPEILPEDIINKMGASQPKQAMRHIPVITPEIRKEVIKGADAIFFGSPTRFGCMTAQMKSFFDALGGLWFEDACVGKVASCFTGTGSQHGGQETTLFSMITPLLHLGFVYVGLPYSCKEQKEVDEISGGTPYGATFIAGSDGSRAVSNNEKACARFQGRHVAQFAKELKIGRMMSIENKEMTDEDEAVNGEKKKTEKKRTTGESGKKKKPKAAAGETKKKPKKKDGAKSGGKKKVAK